jgi:amino acid adenylation domain-containing protein
VDFYATTAPGGVAVLAPGHAPVTYAELAQRTFATIAQLRRLGIAATDRVAVVMPRGAEHGLALLAVATAATCIPVNPDYTADELRRYFAELKLAALVTRADMKSVSREVAHELGIAVIDLVSSASDSLGAFELVGTGVGPAITQGPAGSDDDAFILLTSGTAARPKMVPLTQASVCLSAYNAGAVLSLQPQDRLLNVLPLFHAHGLISGLLTALAAGSSVVLTSGFDAVSFFGWLKEFRPSWYTAVPTIHRALLSAAKDDLPPQTSLRLIRSASASLAPATLEGLEQLFGVPVIETYGMTEGASQIAANPRDKRKVGSVGRAAGPEIAIMDGNGRMQPAGEHGEIVLRGPSMFRAYYNNPEATEVAFREGWFRTGDLGYLDADGYLFIVGRIKDVINRGGQKVSPSEVEEVLLSHADVLEAGAFAIPHNKLGENVAAVVTLRPNRVASPSQLRQFVRQRLAAYKVPSLIRIVAEIPKGASGKIKRGELAGLIAGASGDDTPIRLPRSELESLLAGLWANLLELPQIGVDQDVFALGADSLVVTQLLSRLRAQLGVHLTFGDVFDAPTAAALADRLQSAVKERGEGVPLWRSGEVNGARAPLSFQQQRMYLLSRLDPTQYNYNIIEVARLSGALDVAALQASLQAVCARHEILRSTFAEVEGEPVQTAQAAAQQLERVDARGCAPGKRAAQIKREAMRLAHHAFALDRELPLRVVLLTFGKTDHALIVGIHHLATDGWSQRLFWEELAAHYAAVCAGKLVALPQSPYQYRDFAAWQQGWAQTEAAKEQLSYWRRQLDGVTTLPLRTDRPRPEVWSGRGARHDFRISHTLSAAIRSLSQAQSVTPFMTLLAAFQCLLYRLTGHEDVAIGSLIANRNQIEAERLIGLFANTIVLRTELSGDPSFAEVLRRVRQVTLEAYRNQDLPIEEILRALQVSRSRNATPLFQVMFILQNASIEAADFPGLSVARMDIDQQISRFDITLELTEIDGEFHGFFEYATDLFEAATIARMAAQFEMLLKSIAADPQEQISRLPMLPLVERRRLLGWNGATLDATRRGNFAGRFAQQVKRAPKAVAVSGARERLSYSALDRRSRAIAQGLARLGIGAEMVVALLAERSADLLAAMIAVQRVGAAFASLDPSQPAARLAAIIQASDPRVIVVAKSCAAKFREVRSAVEPRALIVKLEDLAAKVQAKRTAPARRASSSLAYVIHTSGSSGTPKGVMIEQRGLANHLASLIAELGLSRCDVIAQTAPQSFVISVWQLLAGPMVGARVHICSDAIVQDPLLLAREIAREGVTVLQIVPSLLRVVLERIDEKPILRAFSQLRLMIATGEPLTADLCRAFTRHFPHLPLINAYGASECSDDVSLHRITAASLSTTTVPVGRPLPNIQAYVLDQHLAPTPTGTIGELYVGGAGVGRGYINDPALTNARFLPDPFSDRAEARLYRSGDLARWRADGMLECLGRADQQVKIRGYRVELKEIEHVLLDHPDVRAAIVELRGEARLIAHIVASAANPPNAASLRDFLKIRLPAHAIPAAFLFLDQLPLNAHGKVDRVALQAPSQPAHKESDAAAITNVPARHATEQALSDIWSDLLKLQHISTADNFFNLGGHSLLAGQMMGRIARTFGVSLPIKTIFEAPTVATLAMRIDEALAARLPAPSLDIPMLEVPRFGEGGPVLPSFSQEQMMQAERALPGLPQFNLPFALRLQGPLDLAALKKALVQVVRRHEALRTAFDWEGDAVVARVAAPETTGPVLEVVDMDEGSDERVKRLNLKRAKLFAEQEAWAPIDPAHAPLARARLLRLSSDDHLLLLTFHHGVADGWSIGLLFDEISSAYCSLRGRRSSAPAVAARPFSDFVRWQRQWCRTGEAAAQLAYWRENLRDIAPIFVGAGTHTSPRPGTPTAHQPVQLQNGLIAQLTRFSAGQNGTLFIALLTGLKALLLKQTGRKDLCVATAMANRTGADMERVVGPFENTVIIRTQLEPELSFAEAFARVRESVLDAHAWQELPFNILAARLAEEDGIDPASLIQVYFTLQNPLRQPLKLPDITVRSFGNVHREGQPVLPIDQTWLSLMLKERPSGVTGSCAYKGELFAEQTMTQWMEGYAAILSRGVAHPDMPLARLLARKAA